MHSPSRTASPDALHAPARAPRAISGGRGGSTTIGRRSASNNQRKRYLAISEFGWDRPDVYDRPQPRMFGNSLLLAGSADTDGQGQGKEGR
ncbi:hypothetical protein ACLUWU_07155 [Bifidobacterium thermophilum]|uniref:hypothetical protein n=1 Tax=Bifidobacterium thermophilum TaxID=33905 RepID=UPI0039949FF2